MGQDRSSTFRQSENPASLPEEEQTGATGGQRYGRPGEQGGRGVSLAMEAGTAGHEPLPYIHSLAHPGNPGPRHTPKNLPDIPAGKEVGKVGRARKLRSLVLTQQAMSGKTLCSVFEFPGGRASQGVLPASKPSPHYTGDGSQGSSLQQAELSQKRPISTGDSVPFFSLCEAAS